MNPASDATPVYPNNSLKHCYHGTTRTLGFKFPCLSMYTSLIWWNLFPCVTFTAYAPSVRII